MKKNGAIIIEGHIQGLSNTRSLGELNIPVIVMDTTNCLARYSKYCKHFFKCPPFNSNELADFLIKIAKEMNLKDWVLVPSNDHAVITIAQNRTMLSEYYKFCVPDSDCLNLICDKSQLMKLCGEINIPHPQTFSSYDLEKEINNIKFPVIIKGKKGLTFYKTTGKKAIQAKNITQLNQQINTLPDKCDPESIIIQEIIPDHNKNKTISFAAFCIEGTIFAKWTGIKIREHPHTFGTATFCSSVFITKLDESSQKLMQKLKYTGVCEIEYIFDPTDNTYKLIEINPRTWLWVGLAKKNGVNFAQLLYYYLNKIPLPNTPITIKQHKWIHLMTDIPYSLLALAKFRLSPVSYFKSFLGKIHGAIFSYEDIKPLIVAPFLMFLRFLNKKK